MNKKTIKFRKVQCSCAYTTGRRNVGKAAFLIYAIDFIEIHRAR